MYLNQEFHFFIRYESIIKKKMLVSIKKKIVQSLNQFKFFKNSIIILPKIQNILNNTKK